MSGHKRNGAGGAHTPARGSSGARVEARAVPLDVGATLAGRTLLITGATGFVGKVALTLLLDRYPRIGKVFVLVRPGTGGSAEARFFEKVAASRPFDPLRQRQISRQGQDGGVKWKLPEGAIARVRTDIAKHVGDIAAKYLIHLDES